MIKILNLNTKVITSPNDSNLDVFFNHYDKAFILESEKETLEGFKECLSLNGGDKYNELSKKYGGFIESIVLVENDNGDFVGAINMLSYKTNIEGNIFTAIALNYIFISKSFRKKGYFSKLINIAKIISGQLLSVNENDFYIFLEINNPQKMLRSDILLDDDFSGITQNQRLQIWERVNAKAIDVNYTQPSLSDIQDHDNSLLLAVIPPFQTDKIPSLILKTHLEVFFSISVLKSKPLPLIAQEQIKACMSKRSHRLLSPTAFFID